MKEFGFRSHVHAYMDPHPSGDGWMVMARPALRLPNGEEYPFLPMGSPDDRLIPPAMRQPKKFDEQGARQAVKNFEHEMRVIEEQFK